MQHLLEEELQNGVHALSIEVSKTLVKNNAPLKLTKKNNFPNFWTKIAVVVPKKETKITLSILLFV